MPGMGWSNWNIQLDLFINRNYMDKHKYDGDDSDEEAALALVAPSSRGTFLTNSLPPHPIHFITS